MDQISTLEDYIKKIREDTKEWSYVWFRGEPADVVDTALLPKLYRKQHNENKLLQMFRMKATTFAPEFVPDRENTDQWLFLAQHFRLPTRLLDWTESALIALYFALLEQKPAVYVLNPMELNRLSLPANATIPSEFPLTWISLRSKRVNPSNGFIEDIELIENIGIVNIRGAWEYDKIGVALPVAIHPTHFHPRMSAQRSCFTVHGKRHETLTTLFSGPFLKKYIIYPTPASMNQMKKDLQLLGVDQSTIYPDLEGLSMELEKRF